MGNTPPTRRSLDGLDADVAGLNSWAEAECASGAVVVLGGGGQRGADQQEPLAPPPQPAYCVRASVLERANARSVPPPVARWLWSAPRGSTGTRDRALAEFVRVVITPIAVPLIAPIAVPPRTPRTPASSASSAASAASSAAAAAAASAPAPRAPPAPSTAAEEEAQLAAALAASVLC
jgi:hypothetical protein